MTQDNDELIAQLNAETARLSWKELEPHFARGVVIRVNKGLDLIKVAAVIARDDKDTLKEWLDSGMVGNATVEEAQDWSSSDAELWSVVVAPFVVVQLADRKLDS